MGAKSLEKFGGLSGEDPDFAPCLTALLQYWRNVDNWLVHEDDAPNPLQHFFEPYNNQGLDGNRTAVERAEEFWLNAINTD